MISIHTVEARDNAMLDVTFENPQGRGEEIRREIAMALDTAIKQLSDRGVEYAKLRTALTPQVDKRELALLFDSTVMNGWYGGEAAEAVLPHMDRKSNHSILAGDIIFKDLDFLLSALNAEGEFWRETSIPVSQQWYVVYITNLSDGGFNRLVDGVRSSRGAIGYVDCTYAGVTKTILSTCIGTRYVKVGSIFVNSHPFDADEDANENAAGWPFADHGYSYCSIADLLRSLLAVQGRELVPRVGIQRWSLLACGRHGDLGGPANVAAVRPRGKAQVLGGREGRQSGEGWSERPYSGRNSVED